MGGRLAGLPPSPFSCKGSPLMNKRHLLPPIVLSAALALAGCNSGPEEPSTDMLSGLADRVVADVREELASENLNLSHGRAGLPDAEISPQGDLIIDGKQIALDAGQRQLVLEYRGRLAEVAESGARVGMEGAALAGKAIKEATRAALNGDTANLEARIEAEADAIRVSAKALCEHLPALHQAQRRLAAAVPEFAPYATMDEKDYHDCHAEVAKS